MQAPHLQPGTYRLDRSTAYGRRLDGTFYGYRFPRTPKGEAAAHHVHRLTRAGDGTSNPETSEILDTVANNRGVLI